MVSVTSNVLGSAYVCTAAVSIYAVYAIFDDFVNQPNGAVIPTGSKQNLEQLSVLMSSFYILILLTSVVLSVLSFKGGDPKHIPYLIFSCFLFFFGFISIIPTGIAASNGSTDSIYGPIISSLLAILVGGSVIIYYLSKSTSHLVGTLER